MVDLKPSTIEELTEVITAAVFHPLHCNLFGYSTSKGAVRLGDQRTSALCDRASISLGQNTANTNSTFFTEIVQSISDLKFHGDHLIAARDYLTVKVWDSRRPDHPQSIIPVHDPLVRQRLCDLYENDCIFDRFRLAWTADGSQIVTGTYQDMVTAVDVTSSGQVSGWQEDISADRSILSLSGSASALKRSSSRRLSSRRHLTSQGTSSTTIDYTKKALNVAVHPTEPTLAVAATSNLFIYSADK